MPVAAGADEERPTPNPSRAGGGIGYRLFRLPSRSGGVGGGFEGLGSLQSHQHRIMIRRQPLLVGPVGVGQHTVALDGELRRHEDVVDAAGGLPLLVVGVERTILGKAQPGGGVAVEEPSRLREDAVYLVVLVDVEVARQHHGGICTLTDALHHQFGGLPSCHHTHMVHVQVVEVEPQSRRDVLELSPGADTDAGGIPAKTGLVGCRREPEMAVVHEPQFLFVVEDGSILALLLAVVTPHADVVVVVEPLEHVAQLRLQHLLRAENVGVLEVQLVAHHLTTLLPAVAVFLVIVVLIPDVVGTHIERLGTRSQDCHPANNDCSKDSVHNNKDYFDANITKILEL